MPSIGYIRSVASVPGVYARNAAKHVSSSNPAISTLLSMPCCTIEFRRVLQIITSAHWTMTIAVKNIVWHVYSNTFHRGLKCLIFRIFGQKLKYFDKLFKFLSVCNFKLCLSLGVWPFLTVRIHNVIHITIVPTAPESDQDIGFEPILHHDNHVTNESR